MREHPIRHSVLLLLIVVVIGSIAYASRQEARNNRTWLPENQRLAEVEVEPNTVTIRNVRDWSYAKGQIVSTEWKNVTVDPNSITRTWFIIEPFGVLPGVGHTFLSFEFDDGSALSFSIQARLEADERFSALRGLINTYELSYQWGTERDFIGRRILYLGHESRMYPLEITKEDSTRLFLSLVEVTRAIIEKPQFYNTLTANCTNLLAKIVNEHYPGKLPYDLSWNFTGYSDLYLMEQGFIEKVGTADETRAAAELSVHADALAEFSSLSSKEFSASIREILGR